MAISLQRQPYLAIHAQAQVTMLVTFQVAATAFNTGYIETTMLVIGNCITRQAQVLITPLTPTRLVQDHSVLW